MATAAACRGTQTAAPPGGVFSNPPSCQAAGSGAPHNALKPSNRPLYGMLDRPRIRGAVLRGRARPAPPGCALASTPAGAGGPGAGASAWAWSPRAQPAAQELPDGGGRTPRPRRGAAQEEREGPPRPPTHPRDAGCAAAGPPGASHPLGSQRGPPSAPRTKAWGLPQSSPLTPKQLRAVEARGPGCPLRKEKKHPKNAAVRPENKARRPPPEPPEPPETCRQLCAGSGSGGLSRAQMFLLKPKEKSFSGKDRDSRIEDFVELTEDMEKEISDALGPGPQDEILSCCFKLQITRKDIQTLRNHCWLNDEVINFYMNLLVERSKKQGYLTLHVFSTFFYPKLKSGGYQTVKRWTEGVNLFEQEVILVPIHLKSHWSLVVIDLREKCVKYLDSMGQNGCKICEILIQYLQDESKTKTNTALNLSEWMYYSMESHEIPQQANDNDCGMFTCKYADCISQDKSITFTQQQMPHFRKKMVWEILHQQLL